MLPIIGADIHYPDGSVYRIPDNGTWAEAPPFGVQCIVYYHDDGLKTLSSGKDVYTWEGEYDGHDIKIGLFMDLDGFNRIIERAFNGEWVIKP